VPVDLEEKTWLSDLVSAELDDYAPSQAFSRLPAELRGDHPDGPNAEARARLLLVRSLRRDALSNPGEKSGPTEAFVEPIRGHVQLVLDLALVQDGPFDLARRRAELAAFFAAAVGALDLAITADPGRGKVDEAAVKKAFFRAGAVLKKRGFPPGDPPLGLPLHAGALASERRLIARVAMQSYRKGRVDPEGVKRHLAFAAKELSLLSEVLAAFVAADHPTDASQRRLFVRQVARLGLPSADERSARSAVGNPRGPKEIARAAGPKIRPFLMEQLLLASLADGRVSGAEVAFLRAYADAAQIAQNQLVTLQAEAARYYAANKAWLDAFASTDAGSDLAGEMSETFAHAITDNLEAIATELRETGELGQLLGKAARGQTLSADERKKVKAQLIDLAKAVPSLAVLAAPGGLILLPLLAKLLPFNILPSGFSPEPVGDSEKPKS
jgi:hypothetical protein